MTVFGSDLPRQATSSRIGISSPDCLLRAAALFWLAAFLLGQWVFFAYLMAFYGVSVATHHPEMWNVFEQFGVTLYVPGDTGGNFAFGSHALGAGIIAFAGGFQLIPQIRHRFPSFHRWNGRIFLTTCIILTLSGFYLVWIRNEPPATFNDLKTTINGLLILICSFFLLRRVLDGDIKNHSRWAIRLCLVANGQWLLRLGVFCYLTLGNIVGKASFGDPFFAYWDFGAFLVPLMALQLFFYAKDSRSSLIKYATALIVIVLTILMIIGVLTLGTVQLKIINGEPLGL